MLNLFMKYILTGIVLSMVIKWNKKLFTLSFNMLQGTGNGR